MTAELDLATIDGTNLPFAISTSGGVITEIISGELELSSNGSFFRKTTARTTITATQSVTTSTSGDGGSYTLDGESLTLTGALETLTGTFKDGEATLQISGRPWVYN